eukprot:TRINITY_DN1490_c2_g1_i1.p1 TRINITY_DN1490_c2_g1~~TRINITY_DN1490_c2_g1_i1.p1  ORF type:complete len:229 (+),score=15.29 TRINITY_DN1490_c2_g1_i1:46-732(+)
MCTDKGPLIREDAALVKTAYLLGQVEARDKMFKVLAYTVRLTHYYEILLKMGKAESVQNTLATFDSAIVDCRQLLNHFKYVQTAEIFRKIYTTFDLSQMTTKLLLLRTVFWTVEVTCSDLGYYAKHIFHSWNAKLIGKGYKFGKSVQLSILICLEIMKYKRVSSDRKLSKEARNEQCKEIIYGIVRCVMDCIMYYTWIESYQPNKGFSYLCGLVSALIGLRGQVLTVM